jgi:hypothetical protein
LTIFTGVSGDKPVNNSLETPIWAYFLAFYKEIHKKDSKILAQSNTAPYLCKPKSTDSNSSLKITIGS